MLSRALSGRRAARESLSRTAKGRVGQMARRHHTGAGSGAGAAIRRAGGGAHGSGRVESEKAEPAFSWSEFEAIRAIRCSGSASHHNPR